MHPFTVALRRHADARRLCAAAAGLALLVAAGTTAAAEFARSFTFSADELAIDDMIGTVTVVAAAGDAFEVTVTVRGDAAAEDLVEFVSEEGRTAGLAVLFPLGEHSRYVYPPLGDDRATLHYRREDPHESSWLKKIFAGMGDEKVTVSGEGRGLQLWADVTVAMPAEASLRVRHGVGEITAREFRGDLDLDTHAGVVAVSEGAGDLRLDTGSGSVSVTSVRGEVVVDTGSGAVTLGDLEGKRIHVDTGSGGVEATGLTCAELLIDTGSGGVVARGITADEVEVDTGSGNVVLACARLNSGRVVVDTGSGGIRLELPPDASARISADTGSGSLEVAITGATVLREERDEVSLQVGDGDARVTLDAGSGSITIAGR